MAEDDLEVVAIDMSDAMGSITDQMIELMKESCAPLIPISNIVGVCPVCAFIGAAANVLTYELAGHKTKDEHDLTDEQFLAKHTAAFSKLLAQQLAESRANSHDGPVPSPTHPGTSSTN